MKKFTIKMRSTNRGFLRGDFVDRYGETCTIHESSLAGEAAIWLGVRNPKPKVCVLGEGWKEIPLPKGAFTSGQMHLTQEMAKALIPLLQKFVKTGRLGR